MRRALELAERGWGRTSPNPMVGAVVVRDDEIVGEGFHGGAGEDHAEVVALRDAGAKAKGATLYANLEPCNHHGRTPPCSEAIVSAGISRVVFATSDPNPVAAGGEATLRKARVVTEVGVDAPAARELNAAFFNSFKSSRPWVTLKLAASIDGAIADHARSEGWLTSEAAQRAVHRLRAGCDAIAVGLGTVLADDPSLTVRGRIQPRVPPTRIVFARAGTIPLDSDLVVTARETPTWIVTTGSDGDASQNPRPGIAQAADLEGRGVRIIRAEDLNAAMRTLFDAGIRSLLVEGGAQLAASMLDNGLVDRLTIFRAPIILGAGGLNAFASARPRLLSEAKRLSIVETRLFDSDIMTTYALSDA